MSNLVYLKESIERMNVFYQTEILRLLQQFMSAQHMNENMHGTQINLTELSTEGLAELELLVSHIQKLEQTLNEDELQKKQYTKEYFH